MGSDTIKRRLGAFSSLNTEALGYGTADSKARCKRGQLPSKRANRWRALTRLLQHRLARKREVPFWDNYLVEGCALIK